MVRARGWLLDDIEQHRNRDFANPVNPVITIVLYKVHPEAHN